MNLHEDAKMKIERKEEQELVKLELFNGRENAGDGEVVLELGYHIFPEYRRKGYAKEACRAAIEYAEEEFGTVQFIVRIGKENIVSKKVAESLGFVRTE